MLWAAHNMRSCREPVGADLNHPIISSFVIFDLSAPWVAANRPVRQIRGVGRLLAIRSARTAMRGSQVTKPRPEGITSGQSLQLERAANDTWAGVTHDAAVCSAAQD